MLGHLVAIDRSGREGKKLPLASGIVTIGRAANCDVRVTCPTVSPHHATIVVHDNQAILRAVSGSTLVNGKYASVWRLRHGDTLSVGGRRLRWHADESAPQPPLQHHALIQKRGRPSKHNRRTSGTNAPNRLKLEIEALHRASMPASGGKQVAVVQPQRRDTSEQNVPPPEARMSPRSPSSRSSTISNTSSSQEDRRRKSLQTATKASMWIESRKQSPRKSTPRQVTPVTSPRRIASAKKQTPLRLTVLRKAQSAHKPAVVKIQDPVKIDHTKQAALLLMTGHMHKTKLSPKDAKRSPSYLIKKPSPVRKTPVSQRKSNRKSGGRSSATPKTSYVSADVTWGSRRGTGNQSILEITDSDAQSIMTDSVSSHYTTDSPPKSPLLPSPRKSALKDPSVKSNRKTESIKFDLSNLENYNESEDILFLSDSSKHINESVSESNITLRFSDSSNVMSPSPRRPISSRSSKIIEKSLGSPVNINSSVKNQTVERSTLTPGTPSPRKSIRGSLILQKALDTTTGSTSTRGSRTRTLINESGDSDNSAFQTKSLSPRSATNNSAFRTKTLSPSNETNNSAYRTKTLSPRKSNRSQNMESYSVVDLVSLDSDETGRGSSVYNSADSINSSVVKFGTPRDSNDRHSRSITRNSSMLSSSTPYVPKTRLRHSKSSPNISTVSSPNLTRNSAAKRRSKSLTTPPNTNQSIINDTKISRTSRGRSRINDSDLLLLSLNEDASPKSSRRITNSDASTSIRSIRKTRSINTLDTGDSPINIGTVSPRNKSNPISNRSIRKTRSINAAVTLDDSAISNDAISPGNKRSPVSKTSMRKTRSIDPTVTLDDSAINYGAISPGNKRSPASKSSIRKTRSINPTVTLDDSAISNYAISPGNKRSPVSKSSIRKTRSINATVTLDDSAINYGAISPGNKRSPASKTSIRKTRSINPTVTLDDSAISNYAISPGNKRSPVSKSSIRKTRSINATVTLDDSAINKGVTSPGNKCSPVSKTSIRKTRSINDVTSLSYKHSPATNTSFRKSRSFNATVTLNESAIKNGAISPRNKRSPVSKTSIRKTRSINATVTLDSIISPGNKLSPASKKSIRKTKSINSSANVDGVITPENRHSPGEEIGTPVLSIQSLLDSSQGSLNSVRSGGKGRRGSKRKTIATVTHVPQKRGRSSAASKSLIVSVKKSLRLSPNVISPLSDDEIVTPKSAVKIIQEAVKNKHSTAKKPQSKRSIIDNLNESDIVKQLFNSPVKRKLSQSMTEISRKQLFDDDVPRKVTRHTIALGRIPESSILNNSVELSPEGFVSPLSTPSNSPNITGVKRLFRKKTPENDLRNISGVKAILRTPRTRKSVANDLTKVSGVKNIFTKSPRNRLSDVRGVKKMFAPSPENDLRRVSGVKTLFKKQRSPKNDLTDVRGVKKLFTRSSPRNDYSNVAGVKNTFAKQPRNDLSDVRGLKNVFSRRKRQTDYNNVSGVENLFNESLNSNKETSQDRLFDQLIGKPPIKAVYSKSYVKPPIAQKKRTAKSLHSSINEITNNVEEWLEKEMQKCLNKDNKQNISKRQSRELKNLVTDTVEGSTSVTASSLRNTTIANSTVRIGDASDRKKSASELYSARKLPIKKRSVAEASLNITQNKSANKSGNQSVSRQLLPLKKRAVVHSTPVKGRQNMTMNASELGRVSPIVAEKTNAHDTSITTLSVPQLPLPKGRRITNNKKIIEELTQEEITANSPNISLKKPRGRPSKASQSRKNTKTEETLTNVKKRRSSIVITKKSPVAKPKPAPKSKKSIESVPPIENLASPKKTRGRKQKSEVKETKISPKTSKDKVPKVTVNTPNSSKKSRGRKQKSDVQETVKSPKRTRTKVLKVTVVVPKASPKLKPRALAEEIVAEKKQTKKASPKGKKQEPIAAPSRRTRQAAEIKVQSPKSKRGKSVAQKSQLKQGKNTNTQEKEPPKRGKKVEPVIEVVETKRGRKVAEPMPQEAASKKGRKVTEVIEVPKEPKPKRGQTIAQVEQPTRRGRRAEPEVVPEPPKRGPKTEQAAKAKKPKSPVKEIKTRGKKVESQASTQSEPVKRGRRNALTEETINIVVQPKRTRKANVDKPDSPVKPKLQKAKSEEVVKKTRGKSTNVEEVKVDKRKIKSDVKELSPVKERATRGRKAVSVAVVEEKTVRGTRKRKSDTSPAKENKSQPAKKSRKTEEVATKKRTTRAAQAEVAPKTTGRRRR